MYTVTFWESDPDHTDNDDCLDGRDYATLEEAEEAYLAPVTELVESTAYVMLDGLEVHRVRRNPGYDPVGLARHRQEWLAMRRAA